MIDSCHSLFSSVLWRLVRVLNRVLPCFLGNDRHDNGFFSSDLRKRRQIINVTYITVNSKKQHFTLSFYSRNNLTIILLYISTTGFLFRCTLTGLRHFPVCLNCFYCYSSESTTTHTYYLTDWSFASLFSKFCDKTEMKLLSEQSLIC